VYLGGESPLRAVMTGTASRSKGVRREAGSEGSVRQNSDSTSRNRIEGQRSGVTQHWMGMPDNHLGQCGGKSGGDRGKGTRLTLGGLCICLGSQTTVSATTSEGCGEVSRGHSSQRKVTKGRIFYGKEQTGILDGCGAAARHMDPAKSV
jgi:hypothetical protein